MSTLRLLLYVVVLPPIFILVHRLYSTFLSYRLAQTLNVPLIVLPVGWSDDWWNLGWPYFAWLKRFPFVDSDKFDFSRSFWTAQLRHKPHRRFGDAFAIVTPGGVELMINDPVVLEEIQVKYRQWYKPETVYGQLNAFGSHVISANGDDWQRHRRIINPAFNEQTHKMVWSEARRQASAMRDNWIKSEDGVLLEKVANDIVVVALHVLSVSAFGQKLEFEAGVREVPPGHIKSYADTLTFLLQNTIPSLLFGKATLPDWVLPRLVRDAKHASFDFRLYMNEAIARTKAVLRSGDADQAFEITTALVKANEAAKQEHKAGSYASAKPMYLSDDDVLGNMYILNVAGFETTANAMTYTIPYLAAHPEVQDWVIEEIDQVCQAGDDPAEQYEKEFPKLIRCLATLYESLRLWAPVTDSNRWPAGNSEVLKVGEREIVIPKGVIVSGNTYAVHSDPRWWGDDSLEWRPQRWVTIDPETKQEMIAPTPPGAGHFPWSAGPRICPGKKFSHAEFTAVISLLLLNHRLEPLVMNSKGHKTKEDGRKAILESIWASQAFITPKIGRRTEAGVVLVPRKSQKGRG